MVVGGMGSFEVWADGFEGAQTVLRIGFERVGSEEVSPGVGMVLKVGAG